jgi:hypothetical protein
MKRKDVYQLEAARSRAQGEDVAQGADRLRWSTRRTSDEFLKGIAKDQVTRWAAENEVYRRMGKAHIEQNEREIFADLKRDALLAAGVNRYLVEPRIRELQREADLIGSESENAVEITLPNALDHLDPTGMLLVEVLSELRRPRLMAMSASSLLKEYFRAIDVGDAAGYATAVLIEGMVADVHAKNEEEMPAVHALKEEVAAIRRARRPEALEDVAAVVNRATKVVATADIAGIGPIVPMVNPQAKAAWDAETAVWEAEQQQAAAAAAVA